MRRLVIHSLPILEFFLLVFSVGKTQFVCMNWRVFGSEKLNCRELPSVAKEFKAKKPCISSYWHSVNSDTENRKQQNENSSDFIEYL